ncbi:hypothetical protein [Pontiella desulfatans]|uniref:hypothetical protein n=1 Tax=Pontiella desulfatans TaxID=2750659 RepID=UPI00109CCC20|nr:hypothetical protein [Pontiella desulfatans]
MRRFATALAKHGVNRFHDIPVARDNEALKRNIMQIPGQRSGVSWSYFMMLKEFLQAQNSFLHKIQIGGLGNC